MKNSRIAAILFFAVIAVNVMDRQMMAILGESIKTDLNLSDTQLGALIGPMFAVFYAVSGIPIAFLADRTNRAKVLGWSTAIAGGFAILGGFARGFGTLALSRAAVAIGDAGGPPAIWSLVSSYHSEDERAKKIGLIQMGAPTGAVLAFLIGGILASSLGWQWGFFFVGGLGILVGLLALLVVPEPRTTEKTIQAVKSNGAQGFGPLLSSISFRWGLAGVAFAGAAMFGLGMWSASVLQREFGWAPDRTGILLGVATALAGFTGTYLSGWYATRRRKQGDRSAEFTVACLATACALPTISLSLIMPSGMLMVVVYGATSFFMLAWTAPTIAAFQLIAPERSRALAASLHVFFVNMFGLGVGPLAIGALSEALEPTLGTQSLSTSLFIVVGASCAGAATCFFVAGRYLKRRNASSSGETSNA